MAPPHLTAVAALVIEHGGGEDEAIAALLLLRSKRQGVNDCSAPLFWCTSSPPPYPTAAIPNRRTTRLAVERFARRSYLGIG